MSDSCDTSVCKRCGKMDEGGAGVNFTNILRAAFTCVDPKSAINTVKSSAFFALLGSLLVKAVRKMLVKLTPGGGVEGVIHVLTPRANLPTLPKVPR